MRAWSKHFLSLKGQSGGNLQEDTGLMCALLIFLWWVLKLCTDHRMQFWFNTFTFTGLGVLLWLYLSYLYHFLLKVTSLWVVLHASLHYCQWQLNFFFFFFFFFWPMALNLIWPHMHFFSIEVCTVLHFFSIPHPQFFYFYSQFIMIIFLNFTCRILQPVFLVKLKLELICWFVFQLNSGVITNKSC